tara:strand:- start:631 stop:1734 length:1104 start_codon:yes stop_codon:yes gene_type:complete
MIVRNEAKRLSRCIASLMPIVGEVCILDTGSEDDTVAVARSLGCTISHFSWCDDFSAARNAALAPCQYPWILSLDADEIIATEDYSAFRALTAHPPTFASRFITRNYTNQVSASGFQPLQPGAPYSEGFSGWFPSAKVRLFPNRDDICFEGAVHELPNPSLERCAIPVVDADIPIHHHPLLHASPNAPAEKQRLYLALGKKKIAASPGDPKAHSELGDQYVDMGAYGEALTAYRQAVALDPGSGMWLKNLGAVLFLLGRYEQARQALQLAVERAPELEEGWRNLGVVLIQRGDPQKACGALSRALALNDRHPDNYRYLALAQQGAGDVAGALGTLEALLQRFPYSEEGRMLYENLMDGGEDPSGISE